MKPAPLGEQLREWRVRRRMSQMDLALDSEISTRHLSFIETGRSKPSAAMLQRLADCLDVPHRARVVRKSRDRVAFEFMPLTEQIRKSFQNVIDDFVAGQFADSQLS